MAKSIPVPAPGGNRLLERLAPLLFNRLRRHLESVQLKSNDVLQEARVASRQVYFPLRCATSFLSVMENGDTIEVGTVGNEGMVGVSVLLGAPDSSYKVIVQVPGEALRGEVRVFQKEIERDAAFRGVVTAYQSAFQAQVSQSAACNGLHPIEKRCCRWLLMTHDRVGTEVLPITHEYLSYMLGVRRASVTDVLGPLRDRGLIANSRGAITIVDRAGLEAASCECYRAIRDEYERLLG